MLELRGIRYLTIAEAAHKLGWQSKSSIYRRSSSPGFPRPAMLGNGRQYFREHELEEWLLRGQEQEARRA